MTAEDLAVGGAGLGGAIGVQDQGPAEPVHAHFMVVGTQQDQVFQPGLAAAGAVNHMVHMASCRRLVAAAWPRAFPVPEDDRATQVVGNHDKSGCSHATWPSAA